MTLERGNRAMKKKLLVFPFDYTNYVLATENECISKYDVTAFVCTQNSPFCNKDAGIFVNKKTGIIVSDQYEQQLGLADSVLLTSGLEEEFIDIYIAKKMQKEILVTKDVLEQLEKNQISFQGIICLEQEVDFDLHCSEELYDIDVPIITVTGAGENCEKFDLQLTVRKIFIEQNYKVFQVGSKEYSTLFELDNWPRYFFSKESICF